MDEPEDKLNSISSGGPASSKVETDLLNARKYGTADFENFKKCLTEENKYFHSPISRQRLLTFTAMSLRGSSVNKSKQKVNSAKQERNIFGQLLNLLVSEPQQIRNTTSKLSHIFSFQLTPVSYCLATPDGLPNTTPKYKLRAFLEKNVPLFDSDISSEAIYVDDGNATIHALPKLSQTFGQLAMCLFNMLPRVKQVHFLTNSYHPHSIKSPERARRGRSQTIILAGRESPLPLDWKNFLHNEENKRQLFQFILSEWSTNKYAGKLIGRKVYYAIGKECFCLSSNDGVVVEKNAVEDLFSNQEEADTRMILHLNHINNSLSATETHDSTVVVRSPDTDVFLLLLHFPRSFHFSNLVFGTGNGNNMRLLNINLIAATHENNFSGFSEAVLGLHAFSGCDTTSAFVRQGNCLSKFNITEE